jgi:hypothetical protein
MVPAGRGTISPDNVRKKGPDPGRDRAILQNNRST